MLFVDSKLKSALPQHRRVMFLSSGFMCLLDLPIQMIWRSVYFDIFLENLLSAGVVLNVAGTGVVQCVQQDTLKKKKRSVSFVGFNRALLLKWQLVTVQLMCMDINKGVILLFLSVGRELCEWKWQVEKIKNVLTD